VRKLFGRIAAFAMTAVLAMAGTATLAGDASAGAAASKPFTVMVIGSFTGLQSYSVPR